MNTQHLEDKHGSVAQWKTLESGDQFKDSKQGTHSKSDTFRIDILFYIKLHDVHTYTNVLILG